MELAGAEVWRVASDGDLRNRNVEMAAANDIEVKGPLLSSFLIEGQASTLPFSFSFLFFSFLSFPFLSLLFAFLSFILLDPGGCRQH